jgi:hypothetical protein
MLRAIVSHLHLSIHQIAAPIRTGSIGTSPLTEGPPAPPNLWRRGWTLCMPVTDAWTLFVAFMSVESLRIPAPNAPERTPRLGLVPHVGQDQQLIEATILVVRIFEQGAEDPLPLRITPLEQPIPAQRTHPQCIHFVG